MSSASARVVAPSRSWFASDLGARATQLVGNELADGVLQYFDPVERGRALAVNQRWRVVGARLEALDEAALWRSELADHNEDFETTKKISKHILSDPLFENPSRAIAESSHLFDPLAKSIARRFENGISLRVEDDGTSSAASFVKFLRFLKAQNHVGRWLIIAPEAEMSKWLTALQELPVQEVPLSRSLSDFAKFTGDWRSSGAGDMLLHLCTYEEAAENWNFIIRSFYGHRNYFILDEGDGQHSNIGHHCWWEFRETPLQPFGFHDLNLPIENRFILYRPRRLIFEDAIFHFVYTVPLDRSEYCADLFPCEDKFTREVVRRSLSSYLDVSMASVAPG